MCRAGPLVTWRERERERALIQWYSSRNKLKAEGTRIRNYSENTGIKLLVVTLIQAGHDESSTAARFASVEIGEVRKP